MTNNELTLNEENILSQLLKELDETIEAKEGSVNKKMTKGEALVKGLVNEALKGNQRIAINIFRFIEKMDKIKQPAANTKNEKEVAPTIKPSKTVNRNKKKSAKATGALIKNKAPKKIERSKKKA